MWDSYPRHFNLSASVHIVITEHHSHEVDRTSHPRLRVNPVWQSLIYITNFDSFSWMMSVSELTCKSKTKTMSNSWRHRPNFQQTQRCVASTAAECSTRACVQWNKEILHVVGENAGGDNASSETKYVPDNPEFWPSKFCRETFDFWLFQALIYMFTWYVIRMFYIFCDIKIARAPVEGIQEERRHDEELHVDRQVPRHTKTLQQQRNKS